MSQRKRKSSPRKRRPFKRWRNNNQTLWVLSQTRGKFDNAECIEIEVALEMLGKWCRDVTFMYILPYIYTLDYKPC